PNAEHPSRAVIGRHGDMSPRQLVDEPTRRRVASGSVGRWVVGDLGRWLRQLGWADAWWSGHAGDAGRGGHLEGAVGLHLEGPAVGEGLQPVVAAAQAAEVGAGGLAVAGVR